MPTPNKRVFFAVEQVLLAPMTGFTTFNASHVAHGVQNMGVKTDFRLEQIFELGQITIYDQIENIPNIEVTTEKALDGRPLIWHLATSGAPARSLSGRSTTRTMIGLGIFADTQDACSGTAVAYMVLSGMYVSALSYNFATNSSFTESVSFVGNNKRWYSAAKVESPSSSGGVGFFGNGVVVPDKPSTINNDVQKRWNFMYNYATNTGTDENGVPIFTSGSVLPRQLPGIDSSGRNLEDGVTGDFAAHVQSVKCSSNFGREEIFELGRKVPYHRYIKFPVQVTSEIEVLSVSGDWIEATESGIFNGYNLQNESIRIVIQDGTRISLGTRNKLQSVTVGGGDTGGNNQTCTYNYITWNDFTVMASSDPTFGDTSFTVI